MSIKGGAELFREIIKSWEPGKVFKVRDLYNEYLTYLSEEDEKVGVDTARWFLGLPGLEEKLVEKVFSKNQVGKYRRAIAYRVREMEEEPEPQMTDKDVKDMADSLYNESPPDEVTDSQIGKSIIYYIEDLKKSAHNIASKAEDEKQGLMKQITDLRASLKQATKELHDERLRSNNLQITLNRMRNAPNQTANQKTFNLGEIATIKR